MNFFLAILVGALGGVFAKAHAQLSPGQVQVGAIDLRDIDPLKGSDYQTVVQNIIDALGTVSLAIVTIMVLIGGFQIITSGGNPEKIKAGKKTILYAAIGFVTLLVAGSIVVIIQAIFT